MSQLNEEQKLILLPQVTQMLAKEAYHYCADCKAHCRQLILTVEALKEVNRAYTALLDSDSQAAGRPTHGFAPMDSLSDICGAYTSYGYCWRPRKDPVHEATGMTLSPCNTPAQGFNAEREKKVATAIRDKCVEKLHQVRDNHLVSNNEHYEKGFNAALKCAELAMRSLTLDQVKPEK